jgi:ATP-dependent DNA helicase RecQ
MDTINDEFILINNIYKTYCSGVTTSIVMIESKKVGSTKAKVEKSIYRLNQLGIIKDWTIENFFSGVFEVEIDTSHTHEIVNQSLLDLIHNYEKDFTLQKYENDTESRYYTVLYKDPQKFTELEKSILILLIWSYDHFAYHRRQSLKNVYENCLKLSNHTITKEGFKETLENYFRFNESSYLLQYIADNPYDYRHWFEIFLNKGILIDHNQMIQLKDQLSRFLESYMQHPGLDMISGLVRLMLDDFENADGASRFSSSISKIKSNEEFDQNDVLDRLMSIVRLLDEQKKAKISKVLLRYFETLDFKFKLYDELEDDYSLAVILDGYTKRLNNLHLQMENVWQI